MKVRDQAQNVAVTYTRALAAGQSEQDAWQTASRYNLNRSVVVERAARALLADGAWRQATLYIR